MNRILEIDPASASRASSPASSSIRCATRRKPTSLTFGPDPSTHSRCTLGGMIGNNSCGTHSLLAGKTVDNVEELSILLYDGTQLTVGATSDASSTPSAADGGRRGEIYRRPARDSRSVRAIRSATRFPSIPRRVSGYNLDELLPENGFNVARALVGTEGTCAIVLEAKAEADPQPAAPGAGRTRLPDAFAAADHVPEILGVPADRPRGLRGHHRRRPPQEGRAASRPDARGPRRTCSSSSDSTMPTRPQQTAQRFIELGEADSRRARASRLYSTTEARAMWRIREVRPARRRGRARRAARVGRMGRRGGRAGEAGRLSARPARAAGRIPLPDRRSTVTSATAAFTCGSTSIWRPRRASASTASSSIAPPTSSSATAARSPASTATANRAARCCRRCSATS